MRDEQLLLSLITRNIYLISSVECIRDNENRLTNQIESANANSVDELEAIIAENEYRVIQEGENIEPLSSESDHNQLKFHKQHFLILIVKWLLINIYGRRPGYLNTQLTDKQLQNKLQYCKDYLNALNIVDAGISHNRGTKFHFHIKIKWFWIIFI